MTQAVPALTGARIDAPTGNSAKISRRSLIAATGAVAVGSGLFAGPALSAALRPENPDGEFWAKHAAYQALVAQWDADDDDSDENWNRWAAKVRKAEAEVFSTQVHTGCAVLAKLQIARTHDIDENLPGKSYTPLDVVEWDIERLSKKAFWFP